MPGQGSGRGAVDNGKKPGGVLAMVENHEDGKPRSGHSVAGIVSFAMAVFLMLIQVVTLMVLGRSGKGGVPTLGPLSMLAMAAVPLPLFFGIFGSFQCRRRRLAAFGGILLTLLSFLLGFQAQAIIWHQ